MADIRTGTVVHRKRLSPILEIFDLEPEAGSQFPKYEAGQYIALRRERCRLTKEVVGKDGRKRYVPDLDESGNPKLGPVTHSYSIASAPFETQGHGRLEFYVVLEQDQYGTLGRLSSSLLNVDTPPNDTLTYVNRITGNFTLPKTAGGFRSVVLVGTGTGLAPFVSMIKQMHFDASHGRGPDGVQYTLIHTNRTYEELAYNDDLIGIEKAGRFDFAYVPTVSRPTRRDIDDPALGRGRANNVLRHMLGMPLREEHALAARLASGADPSRAKEALEKATRPALPQHLSVAQLQKRLLSSSTVILTCGNPSLMEDIHYIAEANHIRFEKEDW
jgi:ferredoxin-NADP reductase